jgi:hypothetical protein
MLPIIIEDYVTKLNESSTSIERRQFYYASLIKIKEAVEVSLKKYESEKNTK